MEHNVSIHITHRYLLDNLHAYILVYEFHATSYVLTTSLFST